jgi:acetyltransferase-like isoleucine patch superfamily enzyme
LKTAPYIHPTADVSDRASIGEGTRVWNEAQVREGARIGAECIVGKGAYVDVDVVVGDRCKLENRASLFRGVTLEDGVFVGPHAVFANDKLPRAVNPDGSLKTEADWTVTPSLVRHGASVGAGAVVLPGVTIGPWALVGAGAVVTANVPAHAIVRGNPARLAGWVCVCGRALRQADTHMYRCDACDRPYHLAELGGGAP